MALDAATGPIGFDAMRALRNHTGLGNYSRGLLQGLRMAEPELPIHLYSARAARPEFAGLPPALNAPLRLPPLPMRGMGCRALWRSLRLGHAAAGDGVVLYHGLSHELPRDLPGRRIPGIVTMHDLLFHTHPELFSAFDRRSYQWRYRWSAEHATALIAVSSWTRLELHRHFDIPLDRIVVIPPARDPRHSIEASTTERARVREAYGLPERYLISVGTLEPRKNQGSALRALAQLDPSLPPLLLVGRDGGSVTSLLEEIHQRGLQGRVLIRTHVTREDLPAVMQGAALALFLSTAEGFGMPVIEAMTAGLPVIIARGGHLADAGGGVAVTVDPGDALDLAGAIEDLLHDRRGATELVAAGRRHAAAFDAVPLAQRLLRVYDAVLAGRPLPVDQTPTNPPIRSVETIQ